MQISFTKRCVDLQVLGYKGQDHRLLIDVSTPMFASILLCIPGEARVWLALLSFLGSHYYLTHIPCVCEGLVVVTIIFCSRPMLQPAERLVCVLLAVLLFAFSWLSLSVSYLCIILVLAAHVVLPFSFSGPSRGH